MKLLISGWKCLIGAAAVCLLTGTTGVAGTNEPHVAQVVKPEKQRVVLVEVTGSRIPQRVVLYGQQANSGSPLYVVQGPELVNTGATSVVGLISLDPSVSVRRHP